MHSLLSSSLVWTEGSLIVFILISSALLGLLLYRPLWWASLAFFVFALYFFRLPVRSCPPLARDTTVIVCPADGTIVNVQFDAQDGLEGYGQKVSIFLSPLDAHVMWSPVAGIIERVAYKPGAFTFAFLPKSSELNERNDIIMRVADNQTLKIRQIAGTFVRRICCWAYAGQEVQAGFVYGMIRFGSRVDIFLPSTVALNVSVGQKVLGGCTVLGHWSAITP